MSLLPTFQSSEEYFEECLIFFKKYQHLYNFANTDLLIEGKLSHISVDNLDNVDVFDSHFDLRAGNNYLRDFFQKLNTLTPKYEFEQNELEVVADVPLSMKKKHEIAYLANSIGKVCRDSKCDTVIDFGSGLGYLDQQLFDTTILNILGLEGNEQNYVSAKKRQRKYHENSIERVKYIRHTITTDSVENIEGYVKDKFPNSEGFCLTGLHACADLTVDALNIFLKMKQARSIVIIPCCYHRMQAEPSSYIFKNFPLSKSLKTVFDKQQGFEFLRVPFLRLAAQTQVEINSNLKDLNFNLLARATLQLYGWKHKCKLRRKKRKAIRMKTMNNDFCAYIKDVATGYYLCKENDDHGEECAQNDENNSKLQFDLDELYSMWSGLDDMTFKKSAIFVSLQNYLQPVFEYFFLYDRLVYMQENNIEHCKITKLFDSKISPRCLALIAHK